MPLSLTPVKITLPPGLSAVHVFVSDDGTCVTMTDASVMCLGNDAVFLPFERSRAAFATAPSLVVQGSGAGGENAGNGMYGLAA